MTQNNAHKKEARQFQRDHPGVKYMEAMRRTKRLKVGDRVRYNMPDEPKVYGVAAGIYDDGAIDVRCNDSRVLPRCKREELEWIDD